MEETNGAAPAPTIGIPAETIRSIFEKDTLAFKFVHAEPVDGRPQLFGKSTLWTTTMIQLIGEPGDLFKISTSVVIGPWMNLNQMGGLILDSVAKIIDKEIGDWVIKQINGISAKLDSSAVIDLNDRRFSFQYIPYGVAGSAHLTIEPLSAARSEYHRKKEVDRMAMFVRRNFNESPKK